MKSAHFFDFFPPPNFLTMPSVGISVENDALRIVHFAKKQNKVVLKAADEVALEAGTISSGDIAKPDKLLIALQNLKNEHGIHFARLALPEEKAYVFETTIPVPEEGELSEAIEFSLDQNIPIAPAEAVFDFSVVGGPFSNNGVESVNVVVVAYPRQVAETWIEILKQAGITVLFLTSEAQAIAHSLLPAGDMRTALLVHFFKDKTIVAIASGGLVRFATTVVNNPENAEKSLGAHEGEKISESVELLTVRDEVKKVYAYWMTRQGAKSAKETREAKPAPVSQSIKSVIISGHVSDMSDVSEYLGKHIGAPAFLGNVWQNAFSLDSFVPEIEFEDSLRFAIAAGVGLLK